MTDFQVSVVSPEVFSVILDETSQAYNVSVEEPTPLSVQVTDGTNRVENTRQVIVSGYAETPIGGQRVVYFTDSSINYADSSDLSQISKAFGLTLQATSLGFIEVLTFGEVSDPSWNWSDGKVYLGSSGLLTQTLPTSGFLLEVGKALSATKLFVNPQLTFAI